MKRKLIEMRINNLIVCDTKQCHFKIKSKTGDPTKEDISQYINQPCPECGNNLLTEYDYHIHMKIIGLVNWLNKWFTWIAYVIPSRVKTKSISVHCHDGVEIK